MKHSQILMGMPINVEIVDDGVKESDLKKIFDYFTHVDEKFSTYKPGSEISLINEQAIKPDGYSDEMKEIFSLSEQTKQQTGGYFDIWQNGKCDPSGLVKGWAIYNAANKLLDSGFKNFFVEAGGDAQVYGHNSQNQPWSIGIRNPFKPKEIVKVVRLTNQGIATSGSYERGQHIYNPKNPGAPITDIVSLSVIGPNVYEADRFATAAFAMGKAGINFIEGLNGLEGYSIDKDGMATKTSGFEKYINK